MRVAQRIEQRPPKPKIAGSSPAAHTDDTTQQQPSPKETAMDPETTTTPDESFKAAQKGPES